MRVTTLRNASSRRGDGAGEEGIAQGAPVKNAEMVQYRSSENATAWRDGEAAGRRSVTLTFRYSNADALRSFRLSHSRSA
jgi:hypothetical protein